jgi:hypothetical protein
MKYAVEIGSDDINTKLRKHWFRRSTIRRGDTQTCRQVGDRINVHLYFQNKESRLKMVGMSKYLVKTKTMAIYREGWEPLLSMLHRL